MAGLTTTTLENIVMATRSLSPKRAAERMQRFRSAVMTIAHYRAKQAVKVQIRARGQKIAEYSCRDIALLAEAELERNREQIIAKAVADVATFPSLASTLRVFGKLAETEHCRAMAATIKGLFSND
jgi:hypothetical protein